MEGNAQMRIFIPFLHTVFQPELQGVHTHSAGQIVSHALCHKIPLRNPISAHGTACHQVRINRVAVRLQNLLILVKLFENIGCVGCNGVSMGSISALVGVGFIFPRHQCAVLPDCPFDLPGKRMAHTGTAKSLLPGQLQPAAVTACLGT